MSETLNYCFPSKHSNNHLPAFRTSRRASSPFRRYFIMRYSSSRTNLRYRWPYASIPRVTASHRLDGRFPPRADLRRGYQASCVDDPVEARAIWYVAPRSGADSGDCDQPFRLKVITDSGDRDHAMTRPTGSARGSRRSAPSTRVEVA